jgi:hypothetical protein
LVMVSPPVLPLPTWAALLKKALEPPADRVDHIVDRMLDRLEIELAAADRVELIVREFADFDAGGLLCDGVHFALLCFAGEIAAAVGER